MSAQLSRSEVYSLLVRMDRDGAGVVSDWVDQTLRVLNGWLARGDGVAVYEDVDFSSPYIGTLKIASFGSDAAQLPGDVPPLQLPDIGREINWRFRLKGTYRGDSI